MTGRIAVGRRRRLSIGVACLSNTWGMSGQALQKCPTRFGLSRAQQVLISTQKIWGIDAITTQTIKGDRQPESALWPGGHVGGSAGCGDQLL